MQYAGEDTIAAIASPPGGAPRGIVRISGPAAVQCLESWFVSQASVPLCDLRRATAVPGELLLRLESPESPPRRLPTTAYVWPTAASYTREPTVELHTVGNPPLLEAVLETACRHGARLARPGEFTQRAFLAGRLDLTQAEAVLGVIDARDARQLDTALRQLAGGIAGPLGELRATLLDLLAHVEAGLDFVDEDIEFISSEALDRDLATVAAQIERLAVQMSRRQAQLPELTVALVGSPNVGKSSLLNALAREEAAIVSDVAGTTRDYLVRQVDLAGIGSDKLTVHFVDTAGFDAAVAGADIDQAAQRHAGDWLSRASLQLLCIDSTRSPNAWEQQILRDTPRMPRIVSLTKCDLTSDASAGLPSSAALPADTIPTSSVTGQGLAELKGQIHALATTGADAEAAVVGATAARCRQSLGNAAAAIAAARQVNASAAGEELVAAEIRRGLDALGEVTGAVFTDDILDRIFSRFCVGK